MGNISLYLDQRRAKNDGTYPVKLYVNHFKRFYVSTSFSCSKENWESNQYSKREPNYKAKNMALRALLNRAEDIVYQLEKEGRLNSVTAAKLKKMVEDAVLVGQFTKERTVLVCFDEFIATKQKEKTIEAYRGTRDKIGAYCGDVSFGSVDKKWLLEFDTWMAEAGLSVNTRSIHMRNLRSVFNYAIDEELTTNYPFRKFSIKSEETRKRSLTIRQLAELRDYPCEPYQVIYRDMFMLMFYLIGVNGIDLFSAKKITNGRLEYRRAKTGKLYSIRIEPEAMEIIDRYRGKKHLLRILDDCSSHKDFLHRMSEGLKKIGKCERSGRGGRKTITPMFPEISSYWARHTWATVAASLDIPKETISAALGHEIGSPITSIYIKFDQTKVDDANRKVLDYLKSYPR